MGRRLVVDRPWVRTIVHDFDLPGSFSRFRVAAINAGSCVRAGFPEPAPRLRVHHVSAVYAID